MAVRLVCLNMQRSNHLERVIPFLKQSGADVACIQELFEDDIPAIADALGASHHAFVPMSVFLTEGSRRMGLGIFSRAPLLAHEARYYSGDATHLPEIDQKNEATWNNKNFIVLFADIEKEGKTYRIGTTHFTWSAEGKTTDLQREHLKGMFSVLESAGEFVLAGDFNAPRGREIFTQLAARYADNVPADIESSLDPELHRVKGLRLMVDGIFSTPAYRVSNVSMQCGVSDHCALVAGVERD